MRLLITLVAISAAVVTAQSTTKASSSTTTTPSQNPCAGLRSQAKTFQSTHPKAKAVALKPSELYACLKSVPYDKEKILEHIAWLQDVLQFQSTLAFLKDPPSTYQLPAVDLVGGVKNISSFISSGQYTNEYDIELDISKLLNSAYDGHLSLPSPLLSYFTYNRNLSLVSVALDASSTPKVYISSDLKALSNGNFSASAVKSINGHDVKDFAHYGLSMQDPDALYNSALDNPVLAGSGNGIGSFSVSSFTTHDDITTCTFENGTNITIDAFVESTLSAEDLPSNGAAYLKLITAPQPDTSSTPSTPVLGPNYPSPIIKHSHNFMSGYFLNGTENSDVAVLNIASFDAPDDDQIVEFAKKSAQFIAKCKSAGKKRLIIDVRNNPGGQVSLGYTLFQQLFPSMVAYSGIRFHDSDALNLLGQIGSAARNGLKDSQLAELEEGDLRGVGSNFVYQNWIQGVNGPNFTSWQQMYGPVHQHGDSFSNIFAWYNYSTSNFQSSLPAQLNQTSLPAQVFESKDISLLTDGQCSSTCATFANLLINQGDVTTVTVGGRPNNQPMAVIGGVQGAEVLTVSTLQSYAQEAIKLQGKTTGNSSAQTTQARQLLGRLAKPPPLPLAIAGAEVNFLDNIAENDSSVTPLQFSSGISADCRMYYTPADIFSLANTWNRVAKGIKAGGKGLCVNGTVANSAMSVTYLTGTVVNTTSSSTTTASSNGSIADAVAKPFLGAASAMNVGNLGWMAFSVALGTVATVLL